MSSPSLAGGIMILVLLFTDFGQLAPALILVGVITFLFLYMLALIRDLDNPFEYAHGRPGVADVSIDPLERLEARLQAELDTLVPAVPGGGPT